MSTKEPTELVSRVDRFMEDYALAPVPAEKRRSWLLLSAEWLGMTAVMGALYTGVALGSNLCFADALKALLVGTILLSVVMCLTGYVGARTGLATAPLLRFTVGKYGSFLLSVVVGLPMLGWFSMQTGLFGQVWASVFPGVPASVLALIGGLLMATTAIVGYRGLAFLSKVVAIPLFLWIVWCFASSLRHIGGWSALYSYSPVGNAIPNLAVGISTVFGGWAVGAATMPDITRYAPGGNAWRLFILITMGLLIGYVGLSICGIAFSLWLQTWDFGVIVSNISLMGLDSVIVGALIASLAQWTTNDNNLYSAGLAFNNAFPWVKWRTTLVLGIVGSVAGALGVANYFTPFMTLLGEVIPPMAGLLVADHLLLPRLGAAMGAHDLRLECAPLVRWESLLAWVGGVLVGLFTPGVSALNGIVATMVVHCALSMVRARSLAAREAD